MKLIAAPLLIRVIRKSHDAELSQLPVFMVNRLRAPRTLHHRISKRATVRRPNLAAVINPRITVSVTLRTRRQRARRRTKLNALMFSMTINTADSRRFMRLEHGRRKRVSAMTRSTTLLRVA